MAITVFDAYQLACMKNVRILTGDSGMRRPVRRMGILDYEYISYKMQGEFIAGDFVLSSFLFARDEPRLFDEAIRFLIDNGVSLLGIKDVYYKEVPPDLLDYARQKEFSMFLFSYDLYFETIIAEVSNALRLVESNQLLEMKVDNLIENQLSLSVIQTLALEINRDFRSSFFTAYLQYAGSFNDNALYQLLERIRRWSGFHLWDSAFKYRNGVMLIFTFEEGAKVDPRTIVAECQVGSQLRAEDFHIGISGLFSQLHHLDRGIQEALFSARAAAIEHKYSLCYGQIGLYRAALPHDDSYWMERFCREIIQPLQEYDQRFSSELLSTLLTYVDCEGNVKAAAERLFQHENTVRYRIGRIREILHMTEDGCQFYPQVCLAVTLYRASLFR